MLKQFLPIHGTIYHTNAEFQTFGFGELAPPPQILPDQVHPEDDPNLCLAATVRINGSQILRCGPIDSELRMQELNALFHYCAQIDLNKPSSEKLSPRFAILQFVLPDSELGAIKVQRFLLSKFPYETKWLIPHITFPLDLFFYLKKNRPLPVAFSVRSNRISRLHNIEAWLTYSRWILEEFTSFMESIALTDTAKYTLEGALSDFSHEIESSLLNVIWEQLEALTLKQGIIEFANGDDVMKSSKRLNDNETQTLDLRIELQSYLQTQNNLLENIGKIINEMHSLQPEFQPLQAILRIFKELLDVQNDLSGSPKCSFGKQFMLTTLLNTLLRVTAVTTCNTGIERTSLSFSISLAIAQLLKTESLADILRTVLEWDTSVLAVNLKIVEKGHEAFLDWLRNPAEESDNIYQLARLTTKIRLYVYKNLQTFTRPLLKEVSKQKAIESKDIKDLLVSKEFLNFLPDRFIDYDDKTGQPIAVKPEEMIAMTTLFTT
ncbi:MAG: hypothetical protein H0U49_04860 [Parachlamydiaceae bacterium]|nr:hypothetical protein [Parachlamydiaceae bacterium]